METKLIKINNNRGIFINKNTDLVVVMIGGFERAATTEKKFKKLADNLQFSSFRFDYSGVGLSDGDFSKTTVSSMRKELDDVLNNLKRDYSRFVIVAHSLSACVIAENYNFEKIVLVAPALNQRDLLRYYFTISNIDKKVTWSNYKEYLNEEEFLKNCLLDDKMTKGNYISHNYFLENKDKDYSEILKNKDNILHIHGDRDDKAPIESLNIKFNNSIIVKNGDHDVERPDMINQWVFKTIDFIGK